MILGALVNSQEGLNKLIKVEMDIKKAYNLRKFIITLDDKLKAFNQTKDDLIKKYGEEKDGQIQVKQENIQKFYNDLNVILEEEIEIEIPEITIDDLSGNIDTATLLQLTYLIK